MGGTVLKAMSMLRIGDPGPTRARRASDGSGREDLSGAWGNGAQAGIGPLAAARLGSVVHGATHAGTAGQWQPVRVAAMPTAAELKARLLPLAAALDRGQVLAAEPGQGQAGLGGGGSLGVLVPCRSQSQLQDVFGGSFARLLANTASAMAQVWPAARHCTCRGGGDGTSSCVCCW